MCTIERTANSTGGSRLVHLIGKPAVTVDTNRCVVNTLPKVVGWIYLVRFPNPLATGSGLGAQYP